MKSNKKKLTVFITFLLTVVLAISCVPKAKVPETKKPSTPEAPKKEDISLYYPLKEGYEWIYEGVGNEYASYTQKVTYSKDNRFQVMKNNGGTISANIYEVKDDSIVNTYMEGEVYDDRNVLDKESNLNVAIIKLPIEVANKWVSEENSYEIVDINVSITVPAGTFQNCIAVKEVYKDHTAEMFYYYKKGIGLVKSEFKTNDGAVIASLLKSYKLEK